MMLDVDVVAVSPASVWRVLQRAGRLSRWKGQPSRKGTGFEQPPRPHQHWHMEVSYVNVSGTFVYLCSVLDGYSRSIVHRDLRESMTEAEIEVPLQRGREKYPEARPRIISDNGPQFIARDFQEFIRITGMTHVRTSSGYAEANGQLVCWYNSLTSECLRPRTALTSISPLSRFASSCWPNRQLMWHAVNLEHVLLFSEGAQQRGDRAC